MVNAWARGGAIVAGILLAACILACGGAGQPGADGTPPPAAPSQSPEGAAAAPKKSAEELRSSSRAAGVQFAKKILPDHLKSPASAEFPWETVQSRILCDGEDQFGCVVTGAVDAQNAFGAQVRETWEIVAVLDRTEGNWFPIRVAIGNRIVFGSDLAVKELIELAGASAEEGKPPAEQQPEPPAPEPRTWIDSTGEHQVEAEFVSATMGQVKLRKADGSEVVLPMERLSEADQEWLRQRAKR